MLILDIYISRLHQEKLMQRLGCTFNSFTQQLSVYQHKSTGSHFSTPDCTPMFTGFHCLWAISHGYRRLAMAMTPHCICFVPFTFLPFMRAKGPNWKHKPLIVWYVKPFLGWESTEDLFKSTNGLMLCHYICFNLITQMTCQHSEGSNASVTKLLHSTASRIGLRLHFSNQTGFNWIITNIVIYTGPLRHPGVPEVIADPHMSTFDWHFV